VVFSRLLGVAPAVISGRSGPQKVARHSVNADWDEDTHSVVPADSDRADAQEVAR